MANNEDTIAKIMARSGATKEDASLALNRSGGDFNKALMSLFNESANSLSTSAAGVTAQNSFKRNYSQGSKSKSVRRTMIDDDDDIIERPGVPQREYTQGAYAPKQNNKVTSEPKEKSSPPPRTGGTKGGYPGPSSASTNRGHSPSTPGAVGVDGPRIGINSNSPKHSLPAGNSMPTPVEAQVVHDNQEEFESLQEQVQRQQRELDEIRRTHQTVVVGELLTDDEEAQYTYTTNTKKDETPPAAANASTGREAPSTPERKQSQSFTVSKTRWIVIGAGVLAVIIIAIVVAVVFSADKDPTTDDCATETEALQNTAQIQSANAAWNAEFNALINEAFTDQASICKITDNSGTCTFDSKSLSSHEDYLSACAQVGGSAQTYSESFGCSFQSNGENFQIEYSFVDIPECIASSCDQAFGQARVSDLVATFGNQFACS